MFFKCGFSMRIWQEVLRSCLLENDCVDWDAVILLSLRMGVSKTMKSTLFRMSWSVAIYNIWTQRNNIHHGHHVCT